MQVKTLLASLLFCLAFSFSSKAQVTYVNFSASNGGDGASWASAYNNLNTALENTTSGDIWVAQGVYLPDGADSSATFRIQGPVAIYGGFTGTETMLSERDWQNQVTTLSGDLSSNDVDDDFDNFRSDNAQHVVVVDSLISDPVVIDGFTIRGGNTSDFSDQDEFFYRGGGVFAYSTIEVANCAFEQNFGRSGAGVYVSSLGSGGDDSIFENCVFTHNYTTSQSAGIFLNGVSDITIADCDFVENTTVRGALYALYCTNVAVDNCNFVDNIAFFIDGFGGAIWNWNSTGFFFLNCSFIDNIGGNGGVGYLDGTESDADAMNNIFIDCEFENNSAINWGGGTLYAWNASATITNCDFTNNSAANSGGHIFFGGAAKEVNITGCTFEGGGAQFGAAHSCYGEGATFTLTDNTYSLNLASTSGGALINGFKANVTIENCVFEDNEAGFGGAMYNQNDTTLVSINNCDIKGNVATDNGGGIVISNGPTVTISNTLFEANIGGDGGAVYANEADAFEEASLTMENCIINFNQATIQGGGLSTTDMDGTLTNCLFINNASPDGAGGGLLNNATEGDTTVLTLINCTFGNNASPVGANIGQWTNDVDAATTMYLQNCLLSSVLGDNYEIEAGSPELLSTGGNVSSDATMNNYLTHSEDHNEAGDPLFLDPFSFDFRLTAGSPAINVGIADGAPEFDLGGNPRLGAVDAGSYEYQGTSGLEILTSDEMLEVFPNPIHALVQIHLNNHWRGEVQWRLYDQKGVLLDLGYWKKGIEEFNSQLDMEDLAAGSYMLVLQNDQQALVQRLIKQ